MKSTLPLLALLLLSACSQPAQDPKAVAQQYWQALVDNDLETARAMVTVTSQRKFDAHVKAVNTPDDMTQVALDDQRTVVVTTINPDAEKPYRDRPFETILIIEEGEWKIDLDATRLPLPPTEFEKNVEDMTNDMTESVEDNMRTMEEMLDEGLKLFDDSFEQGSKEMSESFGRAMRKMQEAMRDSIDKMKQRREQLEQQPPETAPGTDPATGEGVI